MNKTILFLSFIVASTLQLNAQNVSIPDPNFKSFLVANPAINTNSDTEIQTSEAAAFTAPLICNNQNISDLTGIEAFTSLTVLVCAENQINSLDLSANTALQLLFCEYNQIASLDVSNNTALVQLFCNNNQLTTLNLSANTALTKLYCDSNQITSLDLSVNTALTEVYCRYNQISTLDLSNTNNLQKLYCSYNQLTALNLTDCLTLSTLYCDSNQITSLDFSTIGSIGYIQCSSNNLTTLNLYPMPVLGFLDCSHNQLSSLDLSGIGTSYLQYLHCSDNQISSLDVSSNAGLINLFCEENQLTSLNTNGCTYLDSIYCQQNQLASLNTSSNSSLSTLFCEDNLINILDLSSNTNLTSLNCQNNSLDSLNLANGNNTNVQDFNAMGNSNLECIFVDDATYSTSNWTNIDPGTGFSDGNPSVGIDTHIACSSFTWIDGNIYASSNNTATFKINCDSIVQLDLTIIEIDTSITQDGATLTAVSGNTYQWLDCDNGLVAINGANQVSFTPAQNGIYAVLITTPSGCTDTSACFTINNLSVTEQTDLAQLISIYPNPAKDEINIEGVAAIKSVRILDLQGKELMHTKGDKVTISTLSSGVYLIEITTAKGVGVKKFIKE